MINQWNKWLGTGFITIETKMLEISDFELDFEVPYSFISNFHIKYKEVSERNYKELYPNIVPGSNLEFNSIWDFFMQTIVKVLNDSYYHPYWLYHHPALIAFVWIWIAHSYIDQLYSVKLIFEDKHDDPSPTQWIFKDLEFTDEQINEAKLDIDSMYESASANLTDFNKSN